MCRSFRDAGSNLLGLINDVLDLSKIETRTPRSRSSISISTTWYNAAELVAVRASREKLAYQIRPIFRPRWSGDPNRF